MIIYIYKTIFHFFVEIGLAFCMTWIPYGWEFYFFLRGTSGKFCSKMNNPVYLKFDNEWLDSFSNSEKVHNE